MDNDDLYDEFGNLIGDPMDSDADSSVQNDESSDYIESDNEKDVRSDEMKSGLEVAVRDDNQNSGTLAGFFGKDVEVSVVKPSEEQSDVPVIEPDTIKKMKLEYEEHQDEGFEGLPELNYSRRYMIDIMRSLPDRIRNVAVVGGLHVGKTSFLDMLVLQTHSPSISMEDSLKNFKPLRYLDNHMIEVNRGITIKSSPITLLMPNSNERSQVFNFIDTPGHPNFIDETTAALDAADGAILVLDVVEGLSPIDKKILNKVIQKNKPLVVVINKFDRLILELKLPLADCYFKLNSVINELNVFIRDNEFISSYQWHKDFTPVENNIIFASASLEFSFSLESFTTLYFKSRQLEMIDNKEFGRRLWGNNYFDPQENKFTSNSKNGKLQRSFLSLVLEPLYKIFTYTLTSDSSGKLLSVLLYQNFSVTLHKSNYKLDTQILLKKVFNAVFYGNHGLVDSLVSHIPDPLTTAESLIRESGKTESPDKLVASIVKCIESSDGKDFSAFLRIHSGKLREGDRIKILGENYDEDDDDFKFEIVDKMFLPGGRYKVHIEEAYAGYLVLVSGIDSIVTKGATVYNEQATNSKSLFKNDYSHHSVFKVAVEPSIPSELPKLLEALRKINKSYLSSVIKVEESGEHVILVPGELYMDCVLHDLRKFFTDDLEIKVSDPMTKFSETCIDTSATKITTSANQNSISIIAEPVNDSKLSHFIETGKLKLSDPPKVTSKLLEGTFGWDILSSRSLWCFGPDDLQHASLFVDDTLEEETDQKLLYSVKDSINLGFKWSVNEGPLCDEPVRGTKFKILDAVVNGSEIHRSGTQIIPLTRRACYSGFLTATPRLMEPIYSVNVTCTSRAIKAVDQLISKRRGYITSEVTIPGTHLVYVTGLVPVIESVGFETDVRLRTQGQATCFLDFFKWSVVPGDPLDKDCYLPILKPVPHESLARDFVMKTRKRKGLPGAPNLQKYIDPELAEQLKDVGLIE